MDIRRAAREVRLQLALMALVAVLHVLSIQGVIPNQEALASMLRGLFDRWGLPAVAVLSFTENLVGLNIYFPGSIVILLAMSLTAGNPTRALLTFGAILLPSVFAHIANYFIGRSAGIQKSALAAMTDDGNSRLPRREPSTLEFFLALWHPHTAAIVSIRAGATKMPINRFFRRFVPASACWNVFWGILMYKVGGSMQGAAGNLIILIYVYLIGWMAWDLWQWRKDYK